MPHGHDACPAHMGIKEEKLLPTDHKLHHASVVICRFFRNIFRLKRDLRSISKRFIECLPSLTWLQNSSLGDLLGRVSEPFVVSGVNPFFQRSLRLFRWGGSGCDQVDGVVDVKIFTSAYAIAYHPESVFHSSGNDLDLLLSSYAKTMLECMHWSAVAVSSRPTWRAVREHEGKDLHRLVVQYLKAFKQWRSNEDIYRTERARKLIERVVKARDSLSSVLGSAANVDEEVVPLLQSIRARLEDSIHAIESKCGSGCSSSLSAVFGPGPPPIDWSSFAELYERRWHDRHGIENIQHEVLLDNSYQLSKKFSPCLQSCSLMADLSWRSVGDDLSSVPPRHARFVSILTALQKEFTLFSGGACKAEIDSAFPMKSIARDLAQNGLDNIKCFAILCIIADATRVVREKIGLPKGNLAEEWYNILSDPSSDSKGSWIIVYKVRPRLARTFLLCPPLSAGARTVL